MAEPDDGAEQMNDLLHGTETLHHDPQHPAPLPTMAAFLQARLREARDAATKR